MLRGAICNDSTDFTKALFFDCPTQFNCSPARREHRRDPRLQGLTFEAHRTFAFQKMVIYDLRMDISVTEFKAHCLDLIRQVEESGKAITIRRRGKVVARLEPASSGSGQGKPWEDLRALGGHTQVKANESAWADEDFEALR